MTRSLRKNLKFDELGSLLGFLLAFMLGFLFGWE